MLRDLFRIALGLYFERMRVSGPEKNCRDLQEVVVMVGNKGNADKTQGVVVKPGAPPAVPQAKPTTGAGSTPPNVVQPNPQTNPPQTPASPTLGSETPAPQPSVPQTPQPTTNPQATAGTFAGARDPRALPAGTFIDKTLNDAVRKVFRGNINERSAATEIFEKLNQIAPLTAGAGGTGSQSGSASSSGVTSALGQ